MLKKLKSRGGQAVVELAIALPILLTVLCGILDFGWIYVNQYKVETAAYTAARYAAMYDSVYTSDNGTYMNGIRDRVSGNLMGVTSGETALSMNTEPAFSGTVTATVWVVREDDSVSVTVRQRVRTLTFVAGTLFGTWYTASSTSVTTI